MIFCIIWHVGGPGSVQNTPTRCGSDLPTRGEHFGKITFWQLNVTNWSLMCLKCEKEGLHDLPHNIGSPYRGYIRNI